jgi:hypothetical protein
VARRRHGSGVARAAWLREALANGDDDGISDWPKAIRLELIPR